MSPRQYRTSYTSGRQQSRKRYSPKSGTVGDARQRDATRMLGGMLGASYTDAYTQGGHWCMHWCRIKTPVFPRKSTVFPLVDRRALEHMC